MKDQLIVLVDEKGDPIGIAPKLASHHDHTPLHLAFSVYIFNSAGNLLVTKRATVKKVWPSVWTNSCCGHPMPDESFECAIKRRANYELGIKVKSIQKLVGNYRYITPPNNGIIENEFCPIFIATTTDTPRINYEEVDDYKWMKLSEFIKGASDDKVDKYSWWCKDQIKYLVGNQVFIKYLK